LLGRIEGVLDGTTEGSLLGRTEGVLDGTTEGSLLGRTEGVADAALTVVHFSISQKSTWPSGSSRRIVTQYSMSSSSFALTRVPCN
jgi:hypothetical protein